MSLWPADDRDPDGLGMEGDMRYDYERTRWRRDIERQMRERRSEARVVVAGLMTLFGGRGEQTTVTERGGSDG